MMDRRSALQHLTGAGASKHCPVTLHSPAANPDRRMPSSAGSGDHRCLPTTWQVTAGEEARVKDALKKHYYLRSELHAWISSSP